MHSSLYLSTIGYYKVLGLDRSLGKVDKNGIKKAYRSKSLLLHPGDYTNIKFSHLCKIHLIILNHITIIDKNPAPESSAAFKMLTDAYECLS